MSIENDSNAIENELQNCNTNSVTKIEQTEVKNLEQSNELVNTVNQNIIEAVVAETTKQNDVNLENKDLTANETNLPEATNQESEKDKNVSSEKLVQDKEKIQPEISNNIPEQIQPETTNNIPEQIQSEIINNNPVQIQPEIINKNPAQILPEITNNGPDEIQPEITNNGPEQIQPEAVNQNPEQIQPKAADENLEKIQEETAIKNSEQISDEKAKEATIEFEKKKVKPKKSPKGQKKARVNKKVKEAKADNVKDENEQTKKGKKGGTGGKKKNNEKDESNPNQEKPLEPAEANDTKAGNEEIKIEAVKNEEIKNEGVKNEVSKNEEIHNENIQNEKIQNEGEKNEKIQNEGVQNEDAQIEGVIDEVIKNQGIKIEDEDNKENAPDVDSNKENTLEAEINVNDESKSQEEKKDNENTEGQAEENQNEDKVEKKKKAAKPRPKREKAPKEPKEKKDKIVKEPKEPKPLKESKAPKEVKPPKEAKEPKKDKKQEKPNTKKEPISLEQTDPDQKQKQLDIFAKKYPNFVIENNKIKYPIDDALFKKYPLLFPNLSQLNKPKPEPKVEFIPAEYLGDIVKITHFFKKFDQLIEGPNFEKEELYSAIVYDDEKRMDFLHDCHIAQQLLFVHEFSCNQKYVHPRGDVPEAELFYQLSNSVEKYTDTHMRVIWPEIYASIPKVTDFEGFFPENILAIINEISDKGVAEYSTITVPKKIEALKWLVEAVYEQKIFRNHQTDIILTQKQICGHKSKLNDDIGNAEQELRDGKKSKEEKEVNLKSLECKMKTQTNEQEKEDPENQENNENTNNDEVKTEIFKLKNELGEIEALISKTEKRYMKLKREQLQQKGDSKFIIHPVTMLGQDSERNQYWFFYQDPKSYYFNNFIFFRKDFLTFLFIIKFCLIIILGYT